MYQISNTGELLKARKRLASRRLGSPVSSTVVFLGLTSLFTDISSEMVAAILPLYLVYSVGLTPLQFGVVDGMYQGAAALVRLASGVVADRWRRHKEVAALGYGLSAVCKLGILAVGSAWTALLGIILVDRTGKGIRTAPRDALISLSSPRGELATAFGVHRALDTTGAMLGPLVAFSILTLAPRAFDAVFVVSFFLALIGLAILLLFVQNPPAPPAQAAAVPAVSLRAATSLLGARGFRSLVLVGAALGLVTISDGFVYLRLQQQLDFNGSYLPLLFVGTALVYMLLAVPVGRLADRVGRGRVFVGGYGLLLLVYVSLLLPALGPIELALYLPLLGAYYAATDGVLMALASALLPAELRGSGLALLVTATSVARLLASILFGAIWTGVGVQVALAAFAAGLMAALSIAAVVLVRTKEIHG